jgi:hypothetical protein
VTGEVRSAIDPKKLTMNSQSRWACRRRQLISKLCFCSLICLPGTALSPERRISIQIISRSGTQKAVVAGFHGLELGHGQRGVKLRTVPEWGRGQLRSLNPDDVHHAQILVSKDVTVENEVANVMSTEVDTERDAGKWGWQAPLQGLTR